MPAATGWYVHVNSFPPLHAAVGPARRLGHGPRAGAGGSVTLHAVSLAERLPWRRLLLAVFLAGLAWMLALAFVDGSHGVSKILGDSYEYLRTARRTTDLHATLQEYVSRIRIEAAPHNWPVHLRDGLGSPDPATARSV